VKSAGQARIADRTTLAAAPAAEQRVQTGFFERGSVPSSQKAPSGDATSAVPCLRAAPSRILICRPNARLGNALLLTPLVQEIEATLPGAELDILTACPSAEEIFREFSCVKTVYQLPRRGTRHPLRQLITFLRASRTRYDLILDPCPTSRSSRFATRLLHGRFKLGFRSPQKNRGTDLSVPIEHAPLHMAAYPVHLLRQGLRGPQNETPRAPVPTLSIWLTAAERGFGRRKLRQLAQAPGSTPILAVATRATGAKELPPRWWRAMLRHIEAELPNLQVIEILSATGAARLPEHPAYLSTRIRRLAAVINAADCFVSADSGLMHLGAATSTTTIGLFKITEPSVYAPYGGLNRALLVDDHAPPGVADVIVRLLQETCTSRRSQVAPTRPSR
jgi:ADP-heptose:LPS heptosyltransferase